MFQLKGGFLELKVSREKLNDALRILIYRLNERQTLYRTLEERYTIPISVTADICSNRTDISEASDFIAFAMMDVLNNKRLNSYFTDDEIKTFSSMKYETQKKIEGKLVFENMIQVADDQWIGSISAKRLMELKEAQLIKYNENTQRTLTKVVKGDDRYYKISLNKIAVRQIKESFELGSYIPDDITFNVDVDPDEYNPKKKTLTFSPPKMMDIIDGYHRYIAISQELSENPDFDYPMEIRIVSFSEEKAKQFIYQKDQKTKMKKIKSDSMNRYSPGNQVVDALNTNSSSNIQGMINRNDGKIDYSFLSAVISAYYFSDKRNKYTKKQVIEVTNDLQKKFNTLTTDDMEWLDHNYTEKEIQAIIFCFANDVLDSKSIHKMINGCSDMDGKYFSLTANGHIKGNLKERMENNLERIRDV